MLNNNTSAEFFTGFILLDKERPSDINIRNRILEHLNNILLIDAEETTFKHYRIVVLCSYVGKLMVSTKLRIDFHTQKDLNLYKIKYPEKYEWLKELVFDGMSSAFYTSGMMYEVDNDMLFGDTPCSH